MPHAARQAGSVRSQSAAPLRVPEPAEPFNHVQVVWQRGRWDARHRDRLVQIVIIAAAISIGMIIRIYGSSVRYHQTQRFVALRGQLHDARYELAQLQVRQAHLLSPAGTSQAASDEGMTLADTTSAVRIP